MYVLSIYSNAYSTAIVHIVHSAAETDTDLMLAFRLQRSEPINDQSACTDQYAFDDNGGSSEAGSNS